MGGGFRGLGALGRVHGVWGSGLGVCVVGGGDGKGTNWLSPSASGNTAARVEGDWEEFIEEKVVAVELAELGADRAGDPWRVSVEVLGIEPLRSNFLKPNLAPSYGFERFFG